MSIYSCERNSSDIAAVKLLIYVQRWSGNAVEVVFSRRH